MIANRSLAGGSQQNQSSWSSDTGLRALHLCSENRPLCDEAKAKGILSSRGRAGTPHALERGSLEVSHPSLQTHLPSVAGRPAVTSIPWRRWAGSK